MSQPPEPDLGKDVAGAISGGDTYLYVRHEDAGYSFQWMRIDPQSCAPLWKTPIAVDAVGEGQGKYLQERAGVLVVTTDSFGVISAFDAESGKSLWKLGEGTILGQKYAFEHVSRVAVSVLDAPTGGTISWVSLQSGKSSGKAKSAPMGYSIVDANTSYTYVISNSTLYGYLEDGSPTSWARKTNIDSQLSLTFACQGRLWLTKRGADASSTVVLDGTNGQRLQPGSGVPQRCLDAKTGLLDGVLIPLP